MREDEKLFAESTDEVRVKERRRARTVDVVKPSFSYTSVARWYRFMPNLYYAL